MVMNFLWVALGGVFGACLRYGIELWLWRWLGSHFYGFLSGVFAANMIGCLCAGLLLGWWSRYGFLSEAVRLFLAVGFLASLTTFSTVIHHSFKLLMSGDIAVMFIYLFLTVVLGLGLFFGGFLVLR